MGRRGSAALRKLAPALIVAMWLLPDPVGAVAPSIRVIPRSAGTGDTVALIGIDFCSADGCSRVTVKVDGRVAATDVAVQPDGTFNVPLRISEPEGEYQVTASQNRPGGEVGATTGLIVAAMDYPERTRPPEDYTATTIAGPSQVPVPGSPSASGLGSASTVVSTTAATTSQVSAASAPTSTVVTTAPAVSPGPASRDEVSPSAVTDQGPAERPSRMIRSLATSARNDHKGFPWVVVVLAAGAFLVIGVVVRRRVSRAAPSLH